MSDVKSSLIQGRDQKRDEALALAQSLLDEIPWTPCGHADCESTLKRGGDLAKLVTELLGYTEEEKLERLLHDRSRYQIALRYDDMGLDDIVVKDVEMFRMERMDDDYVWLACYLKDGQEIVFDLFREKKLIKYEARKPLPNVVYEDDDRG